MGPDAGRRHIAIMQSSSLIGPARSSVAPEFDRERFPRALYQYGGTAKESPASERSTWYRR